MRALLRQATILSLALSLPVRSHPKLGNELDATSFSHAIKTATNAAVLARAHLLPVPHIFYPAHIKILKDDCLKHIISTTNPQKTLPAVSCSHTSRYPHTPACVAHYL